MRARALRNAVISRLEPPVRCRFLFLILGILLFFFVHACYGSGYFRARLTHLVSFAIFFPLNQMQEEKEGRLVSIRVSCLLNAEKHPERDGVFILTVEAFLFVLDTHTRSRCRTLAFYTILKQSYSPLRICWHCGRKAG